MVPYIRLNVSLYPERLDSMFLESGEVFRSSGALEPADQEENCVLLAEHMVREAFRRLYRKAAEMDKGIEGPRS